MDYFPEPYKQGTGVHRPEFPLRCDPNSYDDGPLETYPERRGFRLNYWDDDMKFANTLSLPDGSRPSIEQSTKLLQEWLFFGFLSATHSIYGSEFNGCDYVRVMSGTSVLSLEKLPQHFNTWFDLEGNRTKAERKLHFREVERHMMRALRFLTNNFTAETHGSLDPSGALGNVVSEDSRIAVEDNLDILLLVFQEAMEFIVKTIYFRERRDWGGSGPYIVSLSTHGLMEGLNWCPSELNLMGLTFDNSSFCFASQVVRHSANVAHFQCSTSKCHAFELEVSTYRTAHTATCTGCSNIHVDSAELERALTEPGYTTAPRISISTTAQDKVEVHFINDGNYVAISHVWSDGLGHPPGVNALPECQVRRLRQLVLLAGFEAPVVWIDALCVPANPGPGKRNALARMAEVYRHATNVLVLDSDLLSIPSICSNEELLLRVALCKWTRRLWTLEEGVVARSKLLFQLSDKAIRLPAPNKSVTDNIAFNCAELISQYLPTRTDILSVITALHFRSTSWSADEPLCIGYIVGIDVSTIINISDVQLKMLELYRLLSAKDPKFPWQFLFTDEEKLTSSPFRWAPASLLNLQPHDVFYLQGLNDNADKGIDASQTQRGLQFQPTHSCLLSFDEGANIKKCMILRIDALSYVLCPVPKGSKCRSHGRFWEGKDKEKCLSVDPMSDWTESWRPQYNFRPAGNWGLIPSSGGGSYGVMVAITEFKDKVLYGSLIGQVHMYELRTEHSSIINGANKELWGQLGFPVLDEEKVREEQDRVEREVFDPDSYSIVNCAMRLPEGVTWCIG
ncbi:hypothetical protein PV04_08968 [Phialophora macrospora]|uniref:Heterokaryon incompatibility domain-containing protein n=1 Tax=Phialophora macrospora TaxID=1851006 RepID=A0A0D2F7R3_9EURO|nr:hypothetical protein PV04_08968 [Phialophora macrospora]